MKKIYNEGIYIIFITRDYLAIKNSLPKKINNVLHVRTCKVIKLLQRTLTRVLQIAGSRAQDYLTSQEGTLEPASFCFYSCIIGRLICILMSQNRIRTHRSSIPIRSAF